MSGVHFVPPIDFSCSVAMDDCDIMCDDLALMLQTPGDSASAGASKAAINITNLEFEDLCVICLDEAKMSNQTFGLNCRSDVKAAQRDAARQGPTGKNAFSLVKKK